MPSAETPIAREADHPDFVPRLMEDPREAPIPRTREELRAKGFSEDAINEALEQVFSQGYPGEVRRDRLRDASQKTRMMKDVAFDELRSLRAEDEELKKHIEETYRRLMNLTAQVKETDAKIVELYRSHGQPLPSWYKPQF
ncbi:hypothetical protein FA95DRAFT_249612 [Auriscalpium vulgare]|uniref:Uncharacterized protein n=1 Tax=Auriscalpium vulgare TaxID=40419 RepID=A0ACB8RJX5_9AGAM|nr:hypothetical protein FA95DRAFT_249612 [Auriscalpium vulgare]